MSAHPDAQVIYRDIGQEPPPPVTGPWIHAGFTPEPVREPWMHDALRTSDALVDELLRADLIVAGVPMYNFGPPAQLKAYIDKAVWKLCKQHGQKLYAITDMKAGTVSPKPHGRFVGWPDAIAKFDRVGDLYLTNNTMAYFTSKPG